MPCPERFELPTTKFVACHALRGFGPEVGGEESMSNLCTLVQFRAHREMCAGRYSRGLAAHCLH